MEKMIIVGCGQHANVVIYNINMQQEYLLMGYFDAEDGKIGSFINGYQVFENYQKCDLNKLIAKYNTNKFFVGFGNMRYRKKVYESFVNAGWEAVNIFHPNAVISEGAIIGKGVLIEAGCLVTPNPIIGNNVVINTGSQVNHDNVVENHVYIASGVILSGGVSLGENSLIDDGVVVSLGRKIGKNCIIGAGSVVTKDVKSGVIAYGNPARFIRYNEDM